MIGLFRYSALGASIGILVWFAACILFPLFGVGTWMVKNSFEISNYLMASGAGLGLLVWVWTFLKSRTIRSSGYLKKL